MRQAVFVTCIYKKQGCGDETNSRAHALYYNIYYIHIYIDRALYSYSYIYINSYFEWWSILKPPESLSYVQFGQFSIEPIGKDKRKKLNLSWMGRKPTKAHAAIIAPALKEWKVFPSAKIKRKANMLGVEILNVISMKREQQERGKTDNQQNMAMFKITCSRKSGMTAYKKYPTVFLCVEGASSHTTVVVPVCVCV